MPLDTKPKSDSVSSHRLTLAEVLANQKRAKLRISHINGKPIVPAKKEGK